MHAYKLKYKNKDFQLIVKAKLSKNTGINVPELNMLIGKHFHGLLVPKQVKKNVLEYIGPSGNTIANRLKTPISKFDFFLLVEQIIELTEVLETNNFLWSKVVWDMNYSFFNEATKEVNFVYLPITEASTGCVDIMTFLNNVIYSATPAPGDGSDYISRFVYFLRTLSKYEPDKIETYIRNEEVAVFNTLKRQKPGNSGFMTDKPKDFYQHYSNQNNTMSGQNPMMNQNQMFNQNPMMNQSQMSGREFSYGSFDSDATGLLNEGDATGFLSGEFSASKSMNDYDYSDGGATGLLIDSPSVNAVQNSIRKAFLFKVAGEETVSVNKPVFRIGKDINTVDYCLNNNAVSRSHAEIVTKGQSFFIKDLNSKNKTFVNGRVLQPYVEVEINSNDQIVLGNEELRFMIE